MKKELETLKEEVLSGKYGTKNRVQLLLRIEGLEKERFNLTELEKPWVEEFYESEWHPDTLHLTETEEQIISELSTFLPRHMPPYDWNLPFADMTILIIRNILAGKKLINK